MLIMVYVVSYNGGTPKWMAHFMENIYQSQIRMMTGGTPISGHFQMIDIIHLKMGMKQNPPIKISGNAWKYTINRYKWVLIP